jgi:hypothetical protein
VAISGAFLVSCVARLSTTDGLSTTHSSKMRLHRVLVVSCARIRLGLQADRDLKTISTNDTYPPQAHSGLICSR